MRRLRRLLARFDAGDTLEQVPILLRAPMRGCLLLVVLFGPFAGPLASAQTPEPARAVGGATVRGTVTDSTTMRPLVGALVQLVRDDTLAPFGQTMLSDSLGRFAFSSVPSGQFRLGFFHPRLDSLGLEPIQRAVGVVETWPVTANLAIPAPARLRAAFCAQGALAQPRSVVFGIVRDARTGAPIAGATVGGQWVEYVVARTGLTRRTPRRVFTTQQNGWFAICDVPSPGAITLTASRDVDSTDAVEVQVGADGFLQRELFVGASRTVAIGRPAPTDSMATPADPKARPPRQVHVGDTRISGLVVGVQSGRPLPGAQVSIMNGPQVRTDEGGQWVMADAPYGTRTLEVRAVGYYPERITVDVLDSAPPLRVALATFKSVLDTMKVAANYSGYSRLEGFRERSRSGVGRYLTAADIAKRNPLVASDIFRMVPGVYLERATQADTESIFSNRESNVADSTASTGDVMIVMRGLFASRCIPSFFYNGAELRDLTVDDIDMFVRPSTLAGIEVYAAGQVPPMFQSARGGCGAIVLWTG